MRGWRSSSTSTAAAGPDLVIAADYMPGGPGGPSQIFRNNGDGTFTDVTAGSGFDPEGYIVGGMTFADYDGSGRQSIYLTYWTEELGGDPGRTDAIKGRGRARTASTGTSATTASRTSPSRRASASTTPTASRRSSPTSRATAGPTSTRRTTIGPTGST